MEKEAAVPGRLYGPHGTFDIDCETNDVSDGYHTFGELYDHRIALFIALSHAFVNRSWRSKHHEAGGEPMYDGWFVAGIHLATGDVTYHLPMSAWDLMDGIMALKNAPKFDGHTPADVVSRINAWSQKRADDYRNSLGKDGMWPEDEK
jgi:hypothetical protein